MEIKIRHAILHILDATASLPIYSEQGLDLSEEVIEGFIRSHTEKLFHDKAAKYGKFEEQAPMVDILKNLDISFRERSIAVSNMLYKIMKKNVDIPSADLLLAEIEIDDEPHLAIIKLNYREGYTHYVENSDAGIKNKIIVHKVIFASESQKNDEGALIHLDNFSIKVVEKEYLIDGGKRCYFSQLFLGCNTNLSQRESLKVINAVAKDLTKRYYDDNFEKNTDIKSAIYDNLEEQDTVDLAVIAEAVFNDNQQVKKEYMDKVKEAGVEDTIVIPGENPQKAFSKCRLKTDSGIEINIPMDIYKERELIDFINNPDGTVSIIIKQIKKLVSRS